MTKITLQLLRIYGQTFEPEKRYKNSLEEFLQLDDALIEYLKLQTYFKTYWEQHKANDDISQEAYDKLIAPITKMNDPTEAFDDLRKNYWTLCKEKQSFKILKDKDEINRINKCLHLHRTIKQDIWEMVDKDLYDIKIDVVEKEPSAKHKNKYERAISLYWKEDYAESFRLARDIFQQELESKFEEGIKYFESKDGPLYKAINGILLAISKVRNEFAKHSNFNELEKSKQRALTKLSLEQIISIQNFLDISEGFIQ